jgi:diadenosine tetraphosphate (Ap4A) HIT family hydrolase
MSFALHPQLAKDTLEIARWPLSHVLLARDATYPWLILVPAIEGLRDLHDIPVAQHSVAMGEISRASDALQKCFDPVKINVAALGNQVPQLHIHVIARFESDPAWPDPVWGATPPSAYDDAAMVEVIKRLHDAFDERI